jgi:AcrR family transcriptional regulator
MEVFWRNRGTTPQDLVHPVGLGKGSLYHAFGSKRELFSNALDRYRDQQATPSKDPSASLSNGAASPHATTNSH